MIEDHNLKRNVDAFSDKALFIHLADNIFKWGLDRNITAEGGATALSQLKKLREEVQEFEDATTHDEAKDAIGDIQVVLMQICRLRGYDLVDCLHGAWHEIKDRKGRMVEGVFVKEA